MLWMHKCISIFLPSFKILKFLQNYLNYVIRPNIIDTYFAYVVHIIQNKTAMQKTKEIQQKYKSWPCACCKFFCFPHVGSQRHLGKDKQHD